MDCTSCDHKKNPDGGYCYMFEQRPADDWCFHHTMLKTLPEPVRSIFKIMGAPALQDET